jgi:hypothetical protein
MKKNEREKKRVNASKPAINYVKSTLNAKV